MRQFFFLFPAFFALYPASIRSADFQSGQEASLVLGQSSFSTSATSVAANKLGSPPSVVVDPVSGRVFVSDRAYNRVLRYASSESLANGAAADTVYGQATFTDSLANRGGSPAANTFSNQYGIHVDSLGRLWVADTGNRRVLMFPNATAAVPTLTATLVLGQTDFTTGDLFAANSMRLNGPCAVWVDSGDRLWVCDGGNHRVLRFDNASGLSNGANASEVLGQTNFSNATSGVASYRMNSPLGMAVDSAGRLWVADGFNKRVLRFDDAANVSSGADANGVLGKTNFNGAGVDTGASGIGIPYQVAIGRDGRVYVNDTTNNRVVWWNNAAAKSNGAAADGVLGQANFTTTSLGLSASKFDFPTAPFFDATRGHLWVGDSHNNRVLRFDEIDSDNPTVAIKPKKKKILTTATRYKLRGAATDASDALLRVEVKVGNSAYRKAKGTKKWTSTLRLQPGKNRVSVRAIDESGNESSPAKTVIILKDPGI